MLDVSVPGFGTPQSNMVNTSADYRFVKVSRGPMSWIKLDCVIEIPKEASQRHNKIRGRGSSDL